GESSLLDGRLVDQHDGNVVLDRVNALARRALEGGPVSDRRHGRLALRARENLEQLRIDHCVRLVHGSFGLPANARERVPQRVELYDSRMVLWKNRVLLWNNRLYESVGFRCACGACGGSGPGWPAPCRSHRAGLCAVSAGALPRGS